jgi:ribosome maturation factor RimP
MTKPKAAQTAPLSAEVADLLSAPLEARGYELVACQWLPRSSTVRLSIDHTLERALALGAEPTRCAITLADCKAVSQLANEALSALPALAANDDWQLEVSSPGIERPLVHARDYARFSGQPVRFKLKRDAVVRAAKGRLGAGPHDANLVAADAQGADMKLASGISHIAFDDIESAHLRPTF